jgi:hypothetical protein
MIYRRTAECSFSIACSDFFLLVVCAADESVVVGAASEVAVGAGGIGGTVPVEECNSSGLPLRLLCHSTKAWTLLNHSDSGTPLSVLDDHV